MYRVEVIAKLFGDFYPRPPRGGRPSRATSSSPSRTFLSTPSARRATLRRNQPAQYVLISIHALREEGDIVSGGGGFSFCNFYPRPPRGGRQTKPGQTLTSAKFLSTPSARRATAPAGRCDELCGISIHALREEGDAESYPNWTKQKQFLSTPSARRATALDDGCLFERLISIHALREEGDLP